MITVTGLVVRPICLDTFADITDAPLVLTGGRVDRNGLLFDGELSDEQIGAIYGRMTSRDDIDQAKRADICAKVAAVEAAPTIANIGALAVASANYMLGE